MFDLNVEAVDLVENCSGELELIQLHVERHDFGDLHLQIAVTFAVLPGFALSPHKFALCRLILQWQAIFRPRVEFNAFPRSLSRQFPHCELVHPISCRCTGENVTPPVLAPSNTMCGYLSIS